MGQLPVSINLLASRPYVILLAVFFLLAIIVFRPWVHGIDGAGYYSWLRSWVIQGDCNTEDEMNHFHLVQPADLQFNVWSINFSRLKNGQFANYYPIGSAVLWAPFFLIAHSVVLLANACGSHVSADGYSTPYILLSMLGSAMWAFAGLSLIYHIVANKFGPIHGALATGTVWLSTPLVFYMYANPAMSHANDVFVNSLFVFVWLATRRDRTWSGWLLLGLATGLAAMVRTQNGLLVVFPCFELLVFFIASLGQRIWTSLWKTVGRASIFIGGALAAFLPQMLVWKTVFGSYLVPNPQQTSLGLGFDFTGRHVLSVLFSTNRGLFLWSPITILAVAGILLLYRSDRRLAALLLCNFALQLYVVGSWVIWSGGVSFGPRFFLNSVPAFTIGLAVVLSELGKRIPRSMVAALCGAFVLWNFGLMGQYALQLVPRAGEVPLRQMIFNQFAVVPGKIIDLILRAASRS
jgi:hypothetical protein